MENERRVIKVFRAAVMRSFCAPMYWLKVVSIALLAAASPYILDIVIRFAAAAPGMLEAFRQGSGYNIGVLVISELDGAVFSRADELVTGALSGSVTQIIAVLAATGAVSREFYGGYVKLAVMHGANRAEIFAKYMALAAVTSLPLVIISPLCVLLSAAVGFDAGVENPLTVILVLTDQAIMLEAVSVCFAAIVFTARGKGGAVTAVMGLIGLPLIPRYLEIFTNGKMKLESVMLISRLVSSGSSAALDAAGDMITAVVTAAVFFAAGLLLFLTGNYD